MFIRKLWTAVRCLVPIQMYPLLSPIYRWERKRKIRHIQEQDLRYFTEHPHARIPSIDLRTSVVGPCTIDEFIQGGEQTVEDIEDALASVNCSMGTISTFFDFGCGCGRLLLTASQRWVNVSLYGCDVDHRGIQWCRNNLDSVELIVNEPLPPLPYNNDMFDVIWCGSVFTHLDENHQDLWLNELKRIMKTGGILLASVHGPHCWRKRLPPWTLRKLQKNGFIFAATKADSDIHPDWYQVAWHTENYIRSHWAMFFEICSYIPRGFNDFQDLVVAKKSDK